LPASPPRGCEDCRTDRRKSALVQPKDTPAARHATSRCLRWFRWVQHPENVSLWPRLRCPLQSGAATYRGTCGQIKRAVREVTALGQGMALARYRKHHPAAFKRSCRAAGVSIARPQRRLQPGSHGCIARDVNFLAGANSPRTPRRRLPGRHVSHHDLRATVAPAVFRAPYPGSMRTSTTATSPASTAATAWASADASSSCFAI